MYNVRTKTNLIRNYLSKIQHKNKTVWTSNKIVKSPFEAIKVPEVTLNNYIWTNMEKWPEKIAVECGITGRSYRYNEIYKYSRRLAVYLRNKLNLQDKDTVCVMLPNLPEYAIAVLGILEAGCVITTINPIYTSYEVIRQLQLSNAKAIITSTSCEITIKHSLAANKTCPPIINVRESSEGLPDNTICFYEIINHNTSDFTILNIVRSNVNDVCLLPYSSGTTGLPKGVELTNYNLVSNLEQMSAGDAKHHNDTTENHQDTVLQVLPAFHIYGLSVVMLHKLSIGAKLITLPTFNPKTFIDAILKYNVNLLYAVPPIVLFLGLNQNITSKILDNLELIVSAAAPLPLPDVFAILKKSKVYGLTETSPLVTVMPKEDINYSSVGYALPNTELKIVDENDNSLGVNQVGELYVRGPQVMKGYRNNKEATMNTITDDGWFKTGDLASINLRGSVKILDRLKELIKVKGYQVAPAELESILREHPKIKDAAVIGTKHETFGEIPKAFLVVKDKVKLDEKEIIDFVSNKVAPYKQIQEIKFIDELPKTASGKILRRLLKDK